jgi:branched-chain amino acid transport system substrate-binding protein
MKKLIIVLSVLAMALLPAYGGAEVGVSDDQIKIGFWAPMTGFASYFGPSLRNGLQMVLDDVNAGGGIYGRKLVVIHEDDACNATKAMASTKKLLVRDKVFMLFGGPCAHSVTAVCNHAEKVNVPYIMVSSAEEVVKTHHKYCFILGMTTWTQSRLMVDFAIDELKARRIGVVYQTGTYGQGGGQGFITRLKKYGMEPIATVVHKIGDTDYSSQILKLKEANPDVVLAFNYTKEGAMLVRQAWEKGLKTKWVLSTTANIPGVLGLATKEALAGRFYAINLNKGLVEGPTLSDFKSEYAKKFPKDDARPDFPNERDTLSWLAGRIIVDGLKKAGKDLTREKFIKALETMQNYDTGIFPPINISPNDHDAMKSTYWVFYDENGQRQFVNKLYSWKEPFSGSAGPGETAEDVVSKELEHYKKN